jgi:hypothetical protein
MRSGHGTTTTTTNTNNILAPPFRIQQHDLQLMFCQACGVQSPMRHRHWPHMRASTAPARHN